MRSLQVALNLLTGSRVPATGNYDAATEAAVERLQRRLGLPVTGEADEDLQANLRRQEGGILPW